MATNFNFEDRFSYPDASGIAPGIDKTTTQELSDEELLDLSPELNEMVRIVRSYSVLLQSTSALEIFNVITSEADPRVALILAAAKSRQTNMPLFGGLGAVKELMFSDPTRPNQTKYTNRDLFSDGIRRASCALTAARIIGQLAQIKEQAEHSIVIEKQAILDLDRIVQTWELTDNTSNSTKRDEEDIPAGFFFEPLTFTVPAEKSLVVEWQSPSLSPTWAQVGIYRDTVETWQIVNDLAFSINSEAIHNPDNILLAAAELSGPYLTNPSRPNAIQYHALNFYPRRPLPGVVAYSINIRINTVLDEGETDESTLTFPINRTPFVWGTDGESLNSYILNGSIIVIRYNKLSALRSEAEDYTPFVLYFRNKIGASSIPTDARISYRVQPWQPNMGVVKDEEDEEAELLSVTVPALVGADEAEQFALNSNRFSQVALALHNSLADINLQTLISSALIRNDDISTASPMAALELVAWSRQVTISAVILDILELPLDVEVAIGDRARPLTTFSSKPRSAIVPNPLANNSNGLADTVMRKEQPYVISRRKPGLWQAIQDEAKSVTRRSYDP